MRLELKCVNIYKLGFLAIQVRNFCFT